MKKLQFLIVSLILSLVFFSGCTSDITTHQLKKAADICKERNGIRLIQTYSLKKNVVFCMDDSSKFIED
jgi:hypothetical protein